MGIWYISVSVMILMKSVHNFCYYTNLGYYLLYMGRFHYDSKFKFQVTRLCNLLKEELKCSVFFIKWDV